MEKAMEIVRIIVIIQWVLAIYLTTTYGVLGELPHIASNAIKAVAWAWLYTRFFIKDEESA